MAHARIALGSALAVLATSLVALGAPGAAQAACPTGVAADRAPVSETEASAQHLAELCDKPVEVLAAADETTKVLALPDGNFSFESYIEPQRVERDSRWIALDTTLAPGGDGRLRPRAAADVSFSAGGSGPLATYREGGADFTLTWPSALPAGVVSGDAVTYPEVYPGADLVVRAVAGGFSHVLVVKTAEAAANPKVRETAYRIGGSAAVTESAGEVVIKGPRGVVAGAPRAAAWDSTRTKLAPAGPMRKQPTESVAAVADPSTAHAPSDLARMADVDVEVENKSLTVRADASLLTEDAKFPVFIDPTYSKYYQKWIPVSKSSPGSKWVSGNSWPRDVIRIGSNFDDYSDIWRAHTQFDISLLRGKRLIKTPSVDAYLTHTAWCAGESLQLWQTNAIDGNTPTWNGMSGKWLNGKALQTKTVKANNGCSGQAASWVKFNAAGVKDNVQRHADLNYTTITFGLKVSSESGGHWIKAERGKVKLTAEYQSKPSSPVAIRTSPGGGCAASPGPWINDSTPALYGKASDGDNSVKIVFDVNGPTSPADYTSGSVGSGAEASRTTPLLADGNYNWRVYGTDGTDKTGWSGTCYFRQDHTPPTLPVITRTSGTPVLGKPVTLSFASTDALSGVQRFEFGIGVDTRQSNVTAASGKASYTFTAESGRTQIYVWARDNAGNYSARAIYNIFTGRVTLVQPMGVYRLTHDLRDDSGTTDDSGNKDVNATEKDLTWIPSGTPAYGADRAGRGGAALTLTGTACATTIPVIRTDVEFTVGAWVKLTTKSVNRGVVVFGGQNAPAFTLAYHAASDRWETAITNADATSVTWTIARGTTVPALNTWQHIAATVDPVGKVLRLYVGGKVAAETAITTVPWRATGRTLIGCSGTASTTNAPMIGSVDQVGIWTGLLSEAQIAASADELPAGISAAWTLRKTGSDDAGHGYDLTVPEPALPSPEPTDEPSPEPTDDPIPNPDEPTTDPSPDPTTTGDPTEPEPTGTPEVPDETDEPTDPETPDVPDPTPSAPAPVEWTADQYARPESAWYVSGDRCATSPRSVVRSDESFSLAVWARADDTSAMNQTLIGADGNRVSGWFLGARTNAQGVPFWSLMMKGTDDENAASEFAGSTTDAFAATAGKWTHLVGTYNATTKTMALFVNGAKVSSVVRTGTNWSAAGLLTIGCAKYAGAASDHFRGAITDVRVWRGVLTDAEATAVKGANPPVTLQGMWPLEGPRAEEPTNLEDRSGNNRHLSVAGEYSWEQDRFASRNGALGLALDVGSCAETTGPVVRTDGSLSVSAWVALDALTGTRTVVSQSGAVRQGFRIEYFGDVNRWRVVMPTGDTADAPLAEVRSLAAPTAGVWTHVAAVYDLPGKRLHLYIDGDEQGEGVPAPAAPWQAAGPLTVGCTGSTDGRRSNYLGGVVDDVRVWSSTVDADLFGTFAHA